MDPVREFISIAGRVAFFGIAVYLLWTFQVYRRRALVVPVFVYLSLGVLTAELLWLTTGVAYEYSDLLLPSEDGVGFRLSPPLNGGFLFHHFWVAVTCSILLVYLVRRRARVAIVALLGVAIAVGGEIAVRPATWLFLVDLSDELAQMGLTVQGYEQAFGYSLVTEYLVRVAPAVVSGVAAVALALNRGRLDLERTV